MQPCAVRTLDHSFSGLPGMLSLVYDTIELVLRRPPSSFLCGGVQFWEKYLLFRGQFAITLFLFLAAADFRNVNVSIVS
jgi:hypothetical protein